MTGSALQALGVELTCESFVKGEGFGERVVADRAGSEPGGFLYYWFLTEKSSVKNVMFSKLNLNFLNGLLVPRYQLNGESPVNSLTENSPLRLNGLSPLIR